MSRATNHGHVLPKQCSSLDDFEELACTHRIISLSNTQKQQKGGVISPLKHTTVVVVYVAHGIMCPFYNDSSIHIAK